MLESDMLPRGWRAPDKTLIIAASERTGTEMLCRLVDSTGLFKWTRESFNHETYRNIGIQTNTITDILGAIDKLSRNNKNNIGLKLFWHHMSNLEKLGILEEAFPNAYYLFLRREDILGQAISYVRALQTNKWGLSQPGTGSEPRYDEAAIQLAVFNFSRANAWWEYFFATRSVPVLRMTYEELQADKLNMIAKIVSHLGYEPHPANLNALDLGRQRDGLTEEWRAKYLATKRRPLPRLHGEPQTSIEPQGTLDAQNWPEQLPTPDEQMGQSPRNLRNLVRFALGRSISFKNTVPVVRLDDDA